METDKDFAIKILNDDINYNIKEATKIVKNFGIDELGFYIYFLHIMRNVHNFNTYTSENSEIMDTLGNASTDSYKYIISLIIKYGSFKEKKYIHNWQFECDADLVKRVNKINSLYETVSLAKMLDVVIIDKEKRKIGIDISKLASENEDKKIINYFSRLEEDNSIRKKLKNSPEELFTKFKEEYEPVSEIFKQELGINPEEYCLLFNNILEIITSNIKRNEELFPKRNDGSLDVTNPRLCYYYYKGFIQEEDKFLKNFSKKFYKVISLHTFNAEKFDEKQLKFHYLSRKPIIKVGKYFVLSPEIILDSLFTNMHYSLIESKDNKQKYLSTQSDLFLEKIKQIAEKFGYKEVGRGFELYERKNKIGDIDIYFKNNNDDYLLIEAKNHALPLDVYFKNINETKEHLKKLQVEWGKKVERRKNHLEKNHSLYNIPSNFKYIVISKNPEVISHYSDILTLSIQEFEKCLELGIKLDSFEDIYKVLYKNIGKKYSVEDLKQLREANLYCFDIE